MQWWYVKDGQRQGPVEEGELKAMVKDGRLKADDLVWNSSMGQDWQKAGRVPGLSDSHGTDSANVAPPVAEPAAGYSAGPRYELSMPSRPAEVSLVAPVESAWDAMRRVLFAPFDLGKWFIFGFSVWLSRFLSGREPGFSFRNSIPAPGEWGDGGGGGAFFGVFAVIAFVFVVFGIVVSIALLWVRSRGKFMFLDNAVHNRFEVKKPWATFAQHGNSLFLWALGYSVILVAVLLALGGGIYFGIVSPCLGAGTFLNSTIPLIVTLGLVLTIFLIIVGYISRFLEDFVIPIMYKKNMTVSEAWACFGGLYSANTGRFLLYGLWCFLLELGAGLASVALIVCTCCIAFIPYVGTVVLLPIYVLFRFNGLYYLAQYGPGFDLVSGAECNTDGAAR